MNWGYKLMFVFIVFAGLMGTLVYKSINTKFELVTKDYYKDELKYQDRIDAKNEASKLSDVHVVQAKDSIIIHFPKELNGKDISGDAWYYCITDEIKDQHIKFNNISNNSFAMAKSSIRKANYQVKLNCKANNTNYYFEKNIIVH